MTYIPKFPMERDKVVSDKEKVLAKWPDAWCDSNIPETKFAIFVGVPVGGKITAWHATESEAWAAAANPLGGPARMFDAIADRIRAGEDYYAVLADYGVTVEEK